MTLRSFAAAPLALLLLISAQTCTVPINWAVPATLPPPPSITAEDAAAYSALLEDALLDEEDVPLADVTQTRSQGWDIVKATTYHFAGFQDAGGTWVAASRWQQPYVAPDSEAAEQEYAHLSDERLLFQSVEAAQAFFAAHPNPRPDNYVQLAEVTGFAPDAHVYAEAPSPEPHLIPVRVIELRSIAGRIVIQMFVTVHQERADWQEVTRQLLEAAQQRTTEALEAVGEVAQ